MEKANTRPAFRPSSYPSKPSREVQLSLDVNKIPRGRRNPKIDQESDHQVQANQTVKYHDEKLKGKNSVFQPSGDVRNELPQSANNGRSIYSKTLGKSQQRPVRTTARSQSEELVRYMSNVPGFLQRMDKGENIQDKALNVGVLDWGRLEKYKGNQKLVAHGGGNSRLSASGMSNVRAPSFLSVDAGGSSSHYSSHKMHQADGSSKTLKPSLHKFSRSQDFESTSKSCLIGQKVNGMNYSSFGRNSMNPAVTEKVKRSDLDQKGPPKVLVSSLDSAYGEERRYQTMLTSDKKVERDRVISSSSFGAPSLKSINCDVSLLSKDKKSGNREVRNKAGERASRESSLASASENGEKVVLLIPRKCAGSSFSEEQRAPLPPGVDPSSGTNPCKVGEQSCNVHCAGSSSAKPITKPPSLENLKVTNGYDLESQNAINEEAADGVARKDRDPSPNRRFTFNLGRLTRSFSLKESSTPLQFSSGYESVKSGPVTSQSSVGLDIPKAEKDGGPSRARSSPLRRILDPLFKSKASSSSRLSEREKSKEIPPNPLEWRQLESVQSEVHEASYTQAILQVSVKNGLPLFKLLVDNADGKANILAATKNVPSPSKSRSGCSSYTFYAIEEIKKRSGGWMLNPGSNKRGCDYTYNVIGQMNINSSPLLGLTGENLTGHEFVSEHVLFGLEKGEASTKSRSGRELGAVVVRTHSGNIALKQKQQRDEDEQCSSSMTVILPAAVHGLPAKGAPWPLIQRWRSGGSCDCGGWDVGCGLCVLSATAPVASNGFQLFAEGGGKEEKKPVFVLGQVEKGMYSVEFNRRISLLQAFFISVSVVRSQKASDLVEQASFANEPATAKFAPCPPLSPVGRV
ncbi:unnamed protein product [Linum tenue]|uniref:Uncharacterized protein n=1 Tax=Linum tenue TaxID=586396 RepID=A0AAV0KQI4_9ROSI|nr:unnamed protein product [Linum tenue]